jgi:dolichyl-phosphate-mannose-protein mannosyltransferase
MQRQLFLHHYLPSLYFSILCFCAVFDYVTSSVRPRVKLQAAAVVLVLAIWAFAYFSPLTYADHWTKGRCEKAKWLKSWDFSWYVFLFDRGATARGSY